MNSLFKRSPLAAGILLALCSPVYSPQVSAVPGDTVGIEFPVNTQTAGNQSNSNLAMDADGDFVIAWQSLDQDPDDDSYGIYAQRYSADGIKAGGEFLVNTVTSNHQMNASIAMDADGDFVIAWASDGQDGNLTGIYAQRYTADGSTAGSEFLVNTETSDAQFSPSIAIDADGDFVIAWSSKGQDGDGWGIYAQRYSADGAPAGREFLVNTETDNNQTNPRIALNADGDFVITWESESQDKGLTYGVYAQRYTADGFKAGSEFLVNTVTTNDQRFPRIAMNADGDFVIVWESNLQDGSGRGIYAQRYTADGNTTGSEFRVNAETSFNQKAPSIAMDADGDFVIAWQSRGQDDLVDVNGYGIYAQRYTTNGIKVGIEFRVNRATNDNQKTSSIAMDADADFVIAWESNLQDGSGNGVYAQRYEGASQTVDLNLVVQDDVDPVAPGSSFVYSLITTNNGTGTALDVNLLESIPKGLTYVSDDSATVGWGCALTGATVDCSKPFMTVGEASTIQISVIADADARGTLSNTVTVNAAQTDAKSVDNTDSETTVINHCGIDDYCGSTNAIEFNHLLENDVVYPIHQKGLKINDPKYGTGISITNLTAITQNLTVDATTTTLQFDSDSINAANKYGKVIVSDPEYNNGEIVDVAGHGSNFFKRELTVNGVRIMAAGTVGGQIAVPDAFIEKVARMVELFTDVTGSGIDETAQRHFIKTLSGDTGTVHAGLPTIQRVARGSGSDYTPDFLTDRGVQDWNLQPLFDAHAQNDMVWYLNSTGADFGDGDNDAAEVIEHVFHTIHMFGLPTEVKIFTQLHDDWKTGPSFLAMEEAEDHGKWDASGYGPNWKTNPEQFEASVKEYLYLLNFSMFEYTDLWDDGSLAPEWSDDMRTPAGVQTHNPLGYALYNTYIAPVVSKPTLPTIRAIFGDGNTPAQDNPALAGESGYVADPVPTSTDAESTAAGGSGTFSLTPLLLLLPLWIRRRWVALGFPKGNCDMTEKLT